MRGHFEQFHHTHLKILDYNGEEVKLGLKKFLLIESGLKLLRTAQTSVQLAWIAISKGFLPLLFTLLTSAPLCKSHFVASLEFLEAATCKGVFPPTFTA